MGGLVGEYVESMGGASGSKASVAHFLLRAALTFSAGHASQRVA